MEAREFIRVEVHHRKCLHTGNALKERRRMQNKKSKRRRSVYDDVFRTMTVMSSELVLPLLNEMCGDPDRFDGTEKVETLSDDLLLV